jgi:cysteine desulfurase
MAMGFSHQRAHSSIRFSTSRYLSKTEMDYTVERLRETVENLRRLSPLYK